MNRLFSAILSHRDEGYLRLLLSDREHVLNVNLWDPLGEDPLQTAVRVGHSAAVKLLIEFGADPTRRYPPHNRNLLYYAKTYDIFETLCKLGLDINVQDEYGNGLLHYEIFMYADVARIACLLDHGIDVNLANNDGESALMLACQDSLLEIMQLLVQAGADLNHLDHAGNTILFYCHGALCMQYLLEQGVSVHAQNDAGETALFSTCRMIVENEVCALSNALLLLEQGIDLNATNYNGETALMVAALHNLDHLVIFLLSHNALVDVENSNGDSVFSFAQNPLVVEMLYIVMSKQQTNVDLFQ